MAGELTFRFLLASSFSLSLSSASASSLATSASESTSSSSSTTTRRERSRQVIAMTAHSHLVLTTLSLRSLLGGRAALLGLKFLHVLVAIAAVGSGYIGRLLGEILTTCVLILILLDVNSGKTRFSRPTKCFTFFFLAARILGAALFFSEVGLAAAFRLGFSSSSAGASSTVAGFCSLSMNGNAVHQRKCHTLVRDLFLGFSSCSAS